MNEVCQGLLYLPNGLGFSPLKSETFSTQLVQQKHDYDLRDLNSLQSSVPLFIFSCKCQQCAAVGGASSVYCCQEKRFHWNCVYDEHQSQTDTQTLTTYNTPSLCVTQHPRFKQLYLTESGLKEELERESKTEVRNLPKHR